MAYSKKNFVEENGLEFVRVMGTGGGSGFSLKPDFSSYAILCVWKNNYSSEAFFKNHLIFKTYVKKSVSFMFSKLRSLMRIFITLLFSINFKISK